MGLPYHVYRATAPAGKVSWNKHRRMGHDHDAACAAEIFRRILRVATLTRYGEVSYEFAVVRLTVCSGMLESCVAPILILIISMFYKKNEQARSSPHSVQNSAYVITG